MADEQLLVAQDMYLKSGIHIGTKFRTKYMQRFIYKTRPDGLSVFDLQQIDARLKSAANMLAKYAPEQIMIVSRRENGWKPVKAFGKYTGSRIIASRYPPGILTNPQLETFSQIGIIFVTDAWPDRNAIRDAMQVGVPVIALCDTNNQANDIDLVIPCNNKGKKSLGLIFYIITREYLKSRGVIKNDDEFKASLDEFSDE